MAVQWAALRRKRGHYAYYGITGNYRAAVPLVGPRDVVQVARRSPRARMTWDVPPLPASPTANRAERAATP